MNIGKIQKILNAEYLTGDAWKDRKIWSAGGGEVMDDILKPAAKDCVFLTGLTHVEVIRRSIDAGVGCIVFVRGKKIEKDAIDLAAENQLPLLSTSYPLFVACGHLYMSGLMGFEESW